MIRRLATAVAGLALLVAVVAGVWFLVTGGEDGTTEVRGLAGAGPPAFDGDGRLPAGPSRAIYSPDGTRLLVISGGRALLAVDGTLEPITQSGGNVVDAAWFGDSRTILVAEGPASTGTLAVVGIDGGVKGTISLDPRDIGFGTGHGMAVAPGGRRAALTAVEEGPFGARTRYLVEVDLVTGRVVGGPQPEGERFDPHYLADGSVVFSTSERDIVGIVGRDLVVTASGGRLVALDGTDLGQLPDGTAPVDVAPAGDRAVVVADDGDGQPRLREIDLPGLPAR